MTDGLDHGARRIAAFVIAFGVFILDRWSKYLVESGLSFSDTRTVIPGFFNIVRSENPGIAFGIFQDNPTHDRTLILVTFSILAVVLLAAMLWRIDRLDFLSGIAMSFIFGGAMGNVYDRIHVGHVTDFLDFYVDSYHWYTFNIADSAICVGAALLILGILINRPQEAKA
ncbi:MAG TPA: signal peptidase II [Bryobacteraceae bacterium]|nr:signal peptidase II [Bryobacteraceae bacterium]